MSDKTQRRNYYLAEAVTLIVFALLVALPALAQEMEAVTIEATTATEPVVMDESVPTGDRAARRAEVGENLAEQQALSEERQEGRAEMIAEKKAALQEAGQKRILNLAANISNRMDAAIARLLTLTERLQTRIAKLEQAGFDAGEAQNQLVVITQILNDAKALLADIDTLVYTATTSEAPRGNWSAVREQYKAAAQLIRQSHQELRLVINQLKMAVPRTGEAAASLSDEMAATEGTIITSE
jgi:hypothetical protein